MADQKVTKMVMKVDLQCYKCFRKIKRVLCSCPKIRDQVFDEKQNTVTITVVCCSPEKLMERIAYKAGDTVESIEILPDKPKETEKPPMPAVKPKETEKPPMPAVKPKETEKPPMPAVKPKETEKLPVPAVKPKETERPPMPAVKPKETEKPPIPAVNPKQPPMPAAKPKQQPMPAETEKPPKPDKPKVMFVEPTKDAAKPSVPAPTPAPAPTAPAVPPILPEPIVQGFPLMTPTGPVAMCSCCHKGEPYYHGYGQPPTWYDGYVQPAYELPDRNRGYYVNRSDYFSDENASGCSIM